MRKKISNIFVLTGLFVTGSASAASMQCYVDTSAYDYFSSGYCASAGPDRTTSAVFKVSTSKDTNSIIWSGDASGKCSGNNKICAINIRQYQTKSAGATVLYTDGTWENVSAITAEYSGLD